MILRLQVSHVTEGAVWPNGAPADSTRQASNPAEYKQRGLPESWAVTQVSYYASRAVSALSSQPRGLATCASRYAAAAAAPRFKHLTLLAAHISFR